MKPGYKFDPKTGTMIKEGEHIQFPVPMEVVESTQIEVPKFDNENNVVSRSQNSRPIVKMRRVNGPTAIMLTGEDGIPETYLDTDSEGILMFRDREDYDICQITDDRTGKVLAYIGGYALQINFNMAELNTMERIEQCLEGLKKLFRHKIMTQTIKR